MSVITLLVPERKRYLIFHLILLFEHGGQSCISMAIGLGEYTAGKSTGSNCACAVPHIALGTGF